MYLFIIIIILPHIFFNSSVYKGKNQGYDEAHTIEVNIKSGYNFTQKWLVSDFITVKSC